ncbi:MAG: DNA cytosine methyltransferase [Stellaceae bacterium]
MLRGLDIFSGGGGSSAGARAAGIELVAAIDMCPIATETYRANFPSTDVVTSRLEDVSFSVVKKKWGEIDLILASPECTNHTCAKGSAPRDEASRATAMHLVEYARKFRPRWIVLENVVHMRPWSRYGELKQELVELGYHLAEQILDASDFGVPQTRRRLFIVGDRKQAPALVTRKRSGRRPTAKSILDPPGTWSRSPLYRPGRAKATLERAQRAFKELGDDASFILVYYGSDGSGGWQPLTRPLRTITTIDRFALIENCDRGHTMRMLQVAELKKAMGFDTDYQLPVGTRRDRIRLLGNGVCPPVMEAVVRALTVLDI